MFGLFASKRFEVGRLPRVQKLRSMTLDQIGKKYLKCNPYEREYTLNLTKLFQGNPEEAQSISQVSRGDIVIKVHIMTFAILTGKPEIVQALYDAGHHFMVRKIRDSKLLELMLPENKYLNSEEFDNVRAALIMAINIDLRYFGTLDNLKFAEEVKCTQLTGQELPNL